MEILDKKIVFQKKNCFLVYIKLTMTSTTTSTAFINRYESDSDSDSSDSEDEIIQRIPDKFKDVDFSVKEISNITTQLSTNIVKWDREYRQKYINNTTSTGKPRVKPILSTNQWTKTCFIVLDVKYYGLISVKPDVYINLEKSDLLILMNARDTTITHNRGIISSMSNKIGSLKNQLSYSWAQVYKRNN